jgi:flagellar basal-body rod protein FlgB
MIGVVDGVGTSMVKLALDAAVLRHQAIAQNIANLQSEGYVPLQVSFETELAAARRSDLRPEEQRRLLESAKPQLVLQLGLSPGPRPQDADTEMVALSENTIHYQALLKALSRELSILSDVINEGKK